LTPGHTFSGTNENVDLATGNLHVKIPLLHLPGVNGMDLDLNLATDSKGPTLAATPLQNNPEKETWPY
jgi:hypothetical protein